MGKCKVRSDWFQKDDGHGYRVEEWAKKKSDSEVYCLVCMCSINITLKGYQSISNHSNGKKHLAQCSVKLPPRQLRLASVPAIDSTKSKDSSSGSIVTPIKMFDVRESSRVAELKWIMYSVCHNYSANSCDGIGDLFKDIFPSDASVNFTLSRTKFRYVLNEALGPYFKDQIMNDLKGNYFSLMFDETTNVASQKQLTTMIRYSSETQKQIVVHHLETFYMGSATGEQILAKLDEALINADLSYKNLLMLGSDRPNVNKKVYNLMNEKMKLEFDRSLLSIGTCNLHTVHNTFAKGLEKFGEEVSNLAYSIYNFFHGWPLRQEDYRECQKKLNIHDHCFIKHVQSRWLTLMDSSERLIEQFPALKEYFLKYVPKYRSETIKSSSYKTIVKHLDSETCKAEILFVISSAKIFHPFLRSFQTSSPLIQNLYTKLNELVLLLANRVCKKDSLPSSYEQLSAAFFEGHNQNLLPVQNVICGDAVIEELNKCHERSSLEFKLQVQKHFISACTYLLNQIQGKSSTTALRNFRSLSPKERFSKRSCREILNVAKCLPQKVDYIALENEWRLLQLTKTNCDNEIENDKKNIPIDKYWVEIFEMTHDDNSPKFPLVTKTVKAALSLSHGNSEVERSFSVSGNLMPEESSSMSQKTLNSLLTVRSYLKLFDYKPQHLLITKDLLQLARSAGCSYQSYLENERRKSEQKEADKLKRKQAEEDEKNLKKSIEEEKKNLDMRQGVLIEKKKEQNAELKAANRLLGEAHSKLKEAIEKKIVDDVRVANALLEGATAIQKEATLKRKAIDKDSQAIDKKKKSLITQFLIKKQK